MYELVTHKTAIGAEEKRQQQSGAEQVNEVCPGQEYEDQNTDARQCQLAGRECGSALGQHNCHHRIHFHHTAFNQLQRHEGISAAQDHYAYRKEEDPWMVPVDECTVSILWPAQGPTI